VSARSTAMRHCEHHACGCCLWSLAAVAQAARNWLLLQQLFASHILLACNIVRDRNAAPKSTSTMWPFLLLSLSASLDDPRVLAILCLSALLQ
jgi:hypothetical protein